MRILITGGSGLIGGRLGEYLLNAGCEVFLGTRNREAHSWDCLPDVTVVDIDWGKKEILENIGSGLDVVIHAAGINNKDSEFDPEGALRFNGLATSRLLNSAIQLQVPRFIYISTAQVYGKSLFGEITEDSALNNLNPYATSHLAGEYVVRYAHQQRYIDGIVIRLSNSYGAPIHKEVRCWDLLVNDLCRQAATTRRMVLKSSGNQRRSFIPLSSVCYVISKLVAKERYKLNDGLFNVGSTDSMKVLEMAALVQERCAKIINNEIELITAESNDSENLFSYHVEKIKDVGIAFENDHNEEIDRTIMACLKFFS